MHHRLSQEPWTPADPLPIIDLRRRRSRILEAGACLASIAAYLLGWRR